MAFHVQLDENRLEMQLQELISGIRAKIIPPRWIITPDATPSNIVSILEENGFYNLSAKAPDPEPGMLLRPEEFQPYISPEDTAIICRTVQTREEFSVWVDVVNTALHGWAMIDAEHYYKWVETGRVSIYMAEICGTAVSTAATDTKWAGSLAGVCLHPSGVPKAEGGHYTVLQGIGRPFC